MPLCFANRSDLDLPPHHALDVGQHQGEGGVHLKVGQADAVDRA
jgi:hypothetical protein